MNGVDVFRSLDRGQKNTFAASFLGWTLDAFDFFLVTFVVVRLSQDFHRAIPSVAFAITVTLMMRPVGALLFGLLADRYGRRGPLMLDIAFYSLVELATAFSPNFTTFIVFRALYGIGMGGEWGVGAALAMEALPPEKRGVFSGILQEGYAVGYLLAAVAYFLIFPHFGWRGMFVAGVLPALLVFYIRAHVPESAVWRRQRAARPAAANPWPSVLRAQWPLLVYAVLLMTAFNFMSHGTQDLYPTFLQKQRAFGVAKVSALTIIMNVGAIAGGILFGCVSQRIGRRRAILTAAALGVLMVPLWLFSPTAVLLGVGGFSMQFMVQGAWGVVPAHLNELSPERVRGTFPGLTYQMGNLISAGAAQMEAAFARRFPLPGGGVNYAHALAIIALVVFATVIFLTSIGTEARERDFAAPAPEAAK